MPCCGEATPSSGFANSSAAICCESFVRLPAIDECASGQLVMLSLAERARPNGEYDPCPRGEGEQRAGVRNSPEQNETLPQERLFGRELSAVRIRYSQREGRLSDSGP